MIKADVIKEWLISTADAPLPPPLMPELPTPAPADNDEQLINSLRERLLQLVGTQEHSTRSH